MSAAEIVDPYNLERFVQAQDPVYENVCAELRRGGKETHWMWFMFPQLEGLGYSPKSHYFAIRSREEAEAYLNHPVLGARLRECTRLVMLIPDGIGIREIFGFPDYAKFHSCMTLFAHVAQDNELFKRALDRHFNGTSDPATLQRI
jgi:uncharacterized protein (DUF1810 family)